jgi:hypothetical protein
VLSTLRALLLTLLVLALPLQGFAAVHGLHGQGGRASFGAPGAPAGALPDCHQAHAGHTQVDAGVEPVDAKACGVCAACCMASAPFAAVAWNARTLPPGQPPAEVVARPGSAPPQRLERPPRSPRST